MLTAFVIFEYMISAALFGTILALCPTRPAPPELADWQPTGYTPRHVYTASGPCAAGCPLCAQEAASR